MSRLFVPVGPNDHAQGPLDAPVTVVEYGDYQCPYCGEAYPVIKALKGSMGDQLRFVFRNFPISERHRHALHAAEFSEAAAEKGKFWEAHDMLFERQDALTIFDLARYGGEIGLDVAAIQNALDGRFDEKIEADFRGGVRSGVNGTPTLFINGLRYEGPVDLDSLVAAVERARHSMVGNQQYGNPA